MLEHVGPTLFKAWMVTLRWRFVDEYKIIRAYREHHRLIWAFWHGQLVVPAFVGRGRGTHILVSNHRDGEIVSRLGSGLGLTAVRGSTTRGGLEGLRELARAAGTHDIAITPDGPLGPREKVQPGSISLAQVTGRPILPVAGSMWPRKNLRSWDRFMMPLPFGRAAAVAGDPIVVPRDLKPSSRQAYCDRLERELKRITRVAEEACRCRRTNQAHLKRILWK